MRRLTPLVALAALWTAACESPVAPGDRDSLAEAKARWRTNGAVAYQYELNRSCFCILAGRWMNITVDPGGVLFAEFVDPRAGVEAALLSYVPTVPDLFDLIEDALDRRAAYFSAEYDPVYGYPTRIEIDYSSAAADDELAISARGLIARDPGTQ